jgi:hypothetical protein
MAVARGAELASVYVPLCAPGWARRRGAPALPLKPSYDPAVPFHGAAVLAAAIDTALLPTRVTGAHARGRRAAPRHSLPAGRWAQSHVPIHYTVSSPRAVPFPLPPPACARPPAAAAASGAVLGGVDLRSLAELLRPAGASGLAAAALALPCPALPGHDERQMQEAADERSRRAGPSAGPGPGDSQGGSAAGRGPQRSAEAPTAGRGPGLVASLVSLTPGLACPATATRAESYCLRGVPCGRGAHTCRAAAARVCARGGPQA